MGQSPTAEFVNETGTGLPLLNGPTEFGPTHPTPTQFTTDSRKLAKPGDLLFCVRGSTTGRMNWADQIYAIGRGLAAIRHKKGLLFQQFLRGSIEISLPEILAAATGSTFPNVGREQLLQTTVPALSNEDQLNVSKILKSINDKIELNRKTNETLEAMARTLFHAWFVDFEPVRAKMEGRWNRGQSLPGLPAHLYDLFPDRLVESELGEIPEGWSISSFGTIAQNPKRTLKPEEIPDNSHYIALEHMPRQCIALNDWGLATAIESDKYRFYKNEILFGKLRPYFHKVGISPADGVCSTDILVIAPRAVEWHGFVLFLASSTKFVEYTNAASTGTKMPRTNWTDMAAYKTALPDDEIALEFNKYATAVTQRLQANIHESHALAQLRDTLLPRLMSGELRIPDVERIAEASL